MPKGQDPISADLQKHIENLMQLGGDPWFYEIRRRDPNDPNKLYKLWRRGIPANDVDDLPEWCYSVGGEGCEYKIWIKNGNGKIAKGPDGKELGAFHLPVRKAEDPSPSSSVDDFMKDRQADLKRRKLELDLQRQEAQLEKDRRRLQKMMDGDDEDDDDEPAAPWWMDPRQMMMNPMMMQMMNPMGQMTQMIQMMKLMGMGGNEKNSTVELVGALAPVLTAMVSKRDKNPLEDISLLKLLIDSSGKGQLSPKDVFGMVTPMLSEMGKASAEGQKAMMSGMADVDRSIRERLLDIVMADPNKSDDEIEKFRRILNLVGDGMERGAKLIFGRKFKKKKKGEKGKVDVPVEGDDAKHVEGRVKGDDDQDDDNPAEAARQVAKGRVETFLKAMEQEAHIGSDIEPVVEQMGTLYDLLPETLRFKFRAMDTAAIFDSLREYCPNIVDRILRDVEKDKEMKLQSWYEDFWGMMKLPPVDEESAPSRGEPDAEDEGAEEPEEPEPPADPESSAG